MNSKIEKFLVLTVCMMLCYCLIPSNARADTPTQTVISSQGIIDYPDYPTPTATPAVTAPPTPTVTPSPSSSPSPTATGTPTPTPSASTAVNLAPIPSSWEMSYGSGTQIIFYDTTVTHNGSPSIRIEAHTSADINKYRECDGYALSVSPGDHVVMKVWVKTGHSTLGQDGVIGNGAIFGVDLYCSTHRLREVSSSDPDAFTDSGFWTYIDDSYQYVPFNSDWSYRELDFIVPSQVYDESTGSLSTEAIIALIPWVQGSSYITPPNHAQDQGVAWFSDIEIYINP